MKQGITLFLVCAVMLGAVMTTMAADTAAAPVPISVTSKFKVNVYGYVKLDASYDTQKTSAGDLMFYVLPEVNGEKDNEFNMTAKETRLGLDIGGPEDTDMKLTAKVETDFYGPGGSANSANLRLRLAYADLALPSGTSFRAGQDWETFITVIPRIVNFSYLADEGALGLRRPQFRITQDIQVGDTKITPKIAVARTIGEDIDGGGQDDGVDSGLPTLQGNLIVERKLWTTRAAKISASGHLGRETVDSTISNKVVDVDSKDYDSWSVIGSLFLPLAEKVAVQGSIWTGANLDTYYGGIGQGVNKTKETEISAKGGWAQLLLDLTEKVNLNLGYGLDQPDSADLNKGMRSKNEMFFANIFYNLTKNASLAFEYSHITTSYEEQDDAKNDRFQGAAIYKF